MLELRDENEEEYQLRNNKISLSQTNIMAGEGLTEGHYHYVKRLLIVCVPFFLYTLKIVISTSPLLAHTCGHF